ncbi:MAG: PKD domain-containing protein [Candidatus Saccharimonadales bacterium]
MPKCNPRFWKFIAIMIVAVAAAAIFNAPARALVEPPSPGPSSGSVGLEGKIGAPPPKQPATITTPSNGASFTSNPITIAGLCPTGTLIKVFANNIFIGSAACSGGSFSLKADLFNGQNDLLARDFDALGQQGPDSKIVHVSFTSSDFAKFGTLLSLTSPYAERGANPGQKLTWPITINGGNQPYALSVDWGDGSKPSLQSQPFPGNVTINHSYQNAGTYTVLVQASDKNGEAAFLQLVAVIAGKPAQSGATTGGAATSQPSGGGSHGLSRGWAIGLAALVLILMLLTFWLGRRHELFTLRKNLERTGSE